MERRFTNQAAARVQVRQDGDGPAVIEGYGAVYFDGTPETQFELWPGAVERIMRGAFDRAVQEDDIRGLFNHNPDNVLGRKSAGTMRVSTDDRGMRYSIDRPDTSVGRDTAESVSRGDVTGSSFSFSVPEGGQKWRVETSPDGARLEIRELRDVQVFDAGPVTFPAYTGTTTGVRSAEGIDEARQSHAAWKQAASRERAKVATRVGARVAEIGEG